MSILITGVAGFIGSNIARCLVQAGHLVIGFDNLCRGKRSNLAGLIGHERFVLETVELSDGVVYREALARAHCHEPVTEVWHMAANSDISAGIADAGIDWRDTFMTTFNTLEIMKELKIPVLVFASSSAIYGDFKGARIREDMGPLLPISNYGAMKLASEAAISAASGSWLSRAFLYRFPNVIGVPATHGVIYDFIHRLRVNPAVLDVHGNGTQQKAYLHCDDLIDAMLFIRAKAPENFTYYNIGPLDMGVTVRFIAEEVAALVAPCAKINYGEDSRGWVGDVPKFAYSIDKLRALGWKPSLDSTAAVRRAIRDIAEQEMASCDKP
ncbi:NAD-dependent epimerase/dehydratase family protein [Methylovirgula sp. HY1]|uniref:NAD-dependent epimerase/dehydratase family protein n=1 Tax=Methylovirgula sp. HY1 TaxID=2822761 RepID=UPI001C5B9165|nr:NAD-dependent epimerase/dehydratase family protein [Methylovirgula sp. HY1]QXX76662.1 dTDP-glucose 4,6-dehydratase [Methylovirgula sp. HY1]